MTCTVSLSEYFTRYVYSCVIVPTILLSTGLMHSGQDHRAETIILAIYDLFQDYVVLISVVHHLKAINETSPAMYLSWKSVG